MQVLSVVAFKTETLWSIYVVMTLGHGAAIPLILLLRPQSIAGSSYFPMAFTGKRIKDGGRRGEKTKESSSRRQVNAMGCKRVHESIDDSGPWD